jgi:steroid delta-isomerase-like uncharacterized protein
MYARNVSIRIKQGKLAEFNRMLDTEVLPILRRQAGFREEITFAQAGDVDITAISLWDSKEQAEAYHASEYPKVLKAVNAVLDGTPRLQHLNVIQSTMQQAGSGKAGAGLGNTGSASGKAGSASAGSGSTAGSSGSSASAGAGNSREMSSTSESREIAQNKEIVRRFMDECWNKGDQQAMRDLIADKCRYHDPAFPGVENLPQHIMTCRSGFPDLNFTTEDMIAERNEVVVHWTVRGTQRGPFLGVQPTNRACTVSGTSITRVEGGKIVEHWADWNVLTLMQQLGVAAAPRAEEKTVTR